MLRSFLFRTAVHVFFSSPQSLSDCEDESAEGAALHASTALRHLHRATGANLQVPGRSVRLSALGLIRDPHGSVKQIHHEELEDGDKERPSAFPKIMLKQTDSGIQQLHGAGERTQDQQS